MKYTISALNRSIELDDTLVNEYLKYDDIMECNFVLAVISKIGHLPKKEEISEEELSKLCNEVLLDDLKVMIDFPQIITTLERHLSDMNNATKTGTLLNYKISEDT